MGDYPVLDGNGDTLISVGQSGLSFVRNGSQGWWDYGHAGAAVPLTLANTFYQLTNDGLGTYSRNDFAPASLTDIWNVATNELDFSGLEVGDEVSMRVDWGLITTAANRDVTTRMRLGIGSASEFPLYIDKHTFKTAATNPVMRTFKFYIGNTDIRDNPARFEAASDGTGDSVLVDGWYPTLL